MLEPYMSDYYVADNIHRVYYACYGNPKGKTVFVLHGGPGYGFSSDMLDSFDLSAWNVVAIDQRGCGKSQPLGCIENNKTSLLVDDINQIAKKLVVVGSQ